MGQPAGEGLGELRGNEGSEREIHNLFHRLGLILQVLPREDRLFLKLHSEQSEGLVSFISLVLAVTTDVFITCSCPCN